MQRDTAAPHDDLRRATHEAGHVVVALALGWPFEYVTLDPDPKFPGLIGHVRYSRQVRRYSELRVWGATFLGGREAEQQLLGSFGIGSLEDERQVAGVLRASLASEDERASEATAMLLLARTTVAGKRDSILTLRIALVAQRQMSAREVQSLVDAHVARS